MMRFEVHALDGATHVGEGTNIIPGFPAGTRLIGYTVNGRKMQVAQTVIADGEDMVIGFPQIREAFRQGAPRLYKRPLIVREDGPVRA